MFGRDDSLLGLWLFVLRLRPMWLCTFQLSKALAQASKPLLELHVSLLAIWTHFPRWWKLPITKKEMQLLEMSRLSYKRSNIRKLYSKISYFSDCLWLSIMTLISYLPVGYCDGIRNYNYDQWRKDNDRIDDVSMQLSRRCSRCDADCTHDWMQEGRNAGEQSHKATHTLRIYSSSILRYDLWMSSHQCLIGFRASYLEGHCAWYLFLPQSEEKPKGQGIS